MKLEILGSCPTCESLFYDRILQALEMAGLAEKVQVERVKDQSILLNWAYSRHRRLCWTVR